MPPSARRIEMIAPEEQIEAFRLVVEESFGISRDDAIREVGRKLGFDRTTEQLTNALKKASSLAIRRGVILNTAGILRLPNG